MTVETLFIGMTGLVISALIIFAFTHSFNGSRDEVDRNRERRNSRK